MKLEKHSKEPEVFSYENNKGEKLWMFRHKYYDTNGKRREKKKSGFRSDTAAIKALLEIKSATLNGQTKQIEYDNITVGQWLDIWFETNKVSWKITSRKQREMAIRLQMKPLLGKFKLQKLDKTTYIREYINVLKKKYKPSTVQLLHNLFKVAINSAVDDEILQRNRFTKISLYNKTMKNEKKINFFTPDQLNKFLTTAKEIENITNYTFMLTVAYSGARKGEVMGIQWKNVDFKNNTITIERTRDNKGIRTPKTNNSYRTIPVDDVLIQQLKVYRKWCRETMLSFGYQLKNDSFVFISYQTGKPITENSVMYACRRIIKKACLPETLTIHSMRHAQASILLNNNQNVVAIAERLGNTPQMVYEIYGHVFKNTESKSVDIINEALESSGAKIGATHSGTPSKH